MALILKDRVKETSSSSGTGSITLGGAFPGYQTFNAAIATGSTVYYTIHNLTAGSDTEWEVGVGTFTSPATLSRDTVLSSSTGSKVNFTSGVSGLEVFVTQPSEEAVYLNQATGKVEVGGNGTNTVAFTNINASNVVMVSGTISTNASNATDITNKTYVDGLFSQGISYHEAVLVESPTALNAVYVQPNGASNGVGATLTNNGANAALVIDGVTLSNTARVLVYTQSNAVHNGVYTVTNPGAPDSPGPGAQWVLTRATDADTFGLANPNTLGAGDAFFVQDGDTGAGETYVCNTQGTITFGSSNITFAQISSAQIYAAGTGLNLANLTFSIANTAVTAAQYGNDGNVAQITVNAQGQLTNAANVAINASSITVGTLANARTTASDANGASTIVSRDTNGSFAANVITATTVNATSGNFTNITGNAVALTDINASNITSGTIDNARTTSNTSNSASTIVLRDASGNFGSNVITASSFSGDGTAITAINASNISSGTIANSRTTASSSNGASTIVQRDAGGNFSANTITANISGDISGGTNINASNITSGTISNARTTAASANGASTIVLRDTNGSFDANVVNATNLSGGGLSITSINASNISAGTIGSAYVSGAYGNITGVGTVTAGTWQGNVIANLYTTANSSNSASTIVARDAGGNFAAATITATTFSGAFSGNGATISDINASNISSGTIANARTTAATANGASTIVLRGTSGEFSAGAITGSSFTGDGSALSAINASNLSSGTVASARVSGSYTGITGVGTLTAGTWNSTVIGAQYGGTGSANLTAENVILGNGASAVKVVAPGTANNVLTSNGTTWVSQAPSGGGIGITDDNSTNATRYILFDDVTSGNVSSVFVSSTKLTYNPSTGNLVATIHYASSDARYKDDVVVIPNALDKVNQIRGVTYVRNDIADKSRHAGVIAQEVEAVLPEVVSTNNEGYKLVAYDNMIGLLIEAIKELKAEVDALKGK
jgi:hypothetical protein